MKSLVAITTLLTLLISSTSLISANPILLDDQFILPEGFHIYRAVEPKLTGGSYDLTFDGEGQLLVAEGNSLRRIIDTDNNGIYDSQETIATGPPLRGRGPQGLLVIGDNLYTVSGDGVQLFSGYNSESGIKHERRLGAPFNTGGDHAAHTILRGLDGYIYLVSGDGGGINDRKHITQDSSPSREERTASVFRFDPKGEEWECIGSGGRNPPSLGMNYLGEFFSFDSDMEFHVDVPFYRPVRLNHWATGGDQGWQGVGAYPPYYVDCLPGVLEVGRGSPNWGVFYEHNQFPEKYHDAFIVCDYRWKSATTGRYASSGRLVVFHLKRHGGSWRAELTELAKAKAGAKDENGRAINFALVDVDVAPDGSIMATDHNQGVWRIFYNPEKTPKVPPIEWAENNSINPNLLNELLGLPQKSSEWSRLKQIKIQQQAPFDINDALKNASLNQELPSRSRLSAIRLLSRNFQTLPYNYIKKLANSPDEEVRGQAAWLIGIRGKPEHETILKLLNDHKPFVRRRAAEAFMRMPTQKADATLIQLLDDPDRFVRYSAMIALSHRPTSEYFPLSKGKIKPKALIRILVAAHLRKERPSRKDANIIINKLLKIPNISDEDHLDLLRLLAIYQKEIKADKNTLKMTSSFLVNQFPSTAPNIRWEQIRLMGKYELTQSFALLVEELISEKDQITQFHIATSLSDLPKTNITNNKAIREKLTNWIISTQDGWFSEFGGKGLQFPSFWGTIVNKLGNLHADSLVAKLGQIKADSQLMKSVLSNIKSSPNADIILIERFNQATDNESRNNIIKILQQTSSERTTQFMFSQLASTSNHDLRKTLTLGLSMRPNSVKPEFLLSALFEFDDPDIINACSLTIAAARKTLDQIYLDSKNKLFKNNYSPKAVHYRLLELIDLQPASSVQLEYALSTLTGHNSTRKNINPRAIWSSDAQKNGDTTWFAREFNISNKVSKSELYITCDNEFEAHINGKLVGSSSSWEQPKKIDITSSLRPGENLITLECKNLGGPAGLIAKLVWINDKGDPNSLVTNETWQFTKVPHKDWKTDGSKKGNWKFSLDVSKPTENVIKAYNAFTRDNNSNLVFSIKKYWHKWYLNNHGEAFLTRQNDKGSLRADEIIHNLIVSSINTKGDIARGRKLYLNAGCYACHGGIEDQKTTIFGPSLNGATLRLKPEELADAIVYPSKHVPERFKASLLTTTAGDQYNGFITEQTDKFVSITDLQNKITRLRKVVVDSIKPQESSLMPAKLTNSFSDQQIVDLLAFLKSLK
ncbi:MAG: HEAT repeat domain-containing protein [Verrucomicrobiota bacterium]|nr:HEAT repeat domain-containing protein [Verrucomicrobiota bacterium]